MYAECFFFSLNVIVYTDCMCLDSVRDFSRAHTEPFLCHEIFPGVFTIVTGGDCFVFSPGRQIYKYPIAWVKISSRMWGVSELCS